MVHDGDEGEKRLARDTQRVERERVTSIVIVIENNRGNIIID